MKMLKKYSLLFLAIIFAFLSAELITRYLIGYPTFGLDKKVKIRDIAWSNIWKPFSKYWNVEGGNNVYRRNNIGLPGIDVKISNKAKYIFVLGSSFTEALQVSPEKMATSIFHKMLQDLNPNYQVLNLGYSGHDPYDSFRRAKYFSKIFYPEKTILIVDRTYNNWFNRHKKPLNFSINDNFFPIQTGIKTKLNLVRNNFSFINLLANGVKNILQKRGKESNKTKVILEDFVPAEMYETLKEYKGKYRESFLCLSIMDDKDINQKIEQFCLNNNINFKNKTLKTKKNMLNGAGHLNEKGNEELGDFMFETFKKFKKNKL